MDVVEKNRLTKEAQMQINALKKINIWRFSAVALSTIGAALIYAGMAGTDQNSFLGILGIILMVISISGVVVFNLGLKNGRRNVEKIINILEEKHHEV